jgi:CheY-like chemotaxis protein
VHRELSRYRYCTVFVVEGEGLDADAIERELEQLGDSLLVVGDPTALKVHVHTDDPGAALSLGTRAGGTLEGIEIANMHRQTTEREERLVEALDGLMTLVTGVVVVAPGEGNRRLFESMRATRVIEGGQTMNPSTADIVAAIEATPASEVIVLPNNKNVILSAEQAVGLVDKPVRVVPTRTVQAGLAAMVAYDPERSGADNARAMEEAQDAVATGEVTVASRDVELDGVAVRKGAWLGLADGAAVAAGDDFDQVVEAVVERLLAGDRELLHHPHRPGRAVARGPARPYRRAPSTRGGGGARRRPAPLPVAPLGGVAVHVIRVLLVEDNDVYRSTLELLLAQHDDIDVVGAVADGHAGVTAAAALVPDVVLMDFRLPGLDGAEATAAVKGARPQAVVICLTAEATEHDRFAVIAAGAEALIEKGTPTSGLVEAVRSAFRNAREPA